MASSSNPQTGLSSVTEKQLWEIAKLIPGINVTYGTVRCIVYIVKKDDKETAESALGAVSGAVQTAALTAGVFAAPVTIPIAAGVLTGVVAKSVTESMEVLVFFATNAEQFQSKTSDEREQFVYNKLKKVTGIGALYSAARVPVYLFKKDKQQSIESGVNVVENSGTTAVQIGLGMLPNVDEQLHKLIAKTSRYAIKFLANKVLEQVSLKKLPVEEGRETIENVENECQRIIEVTAASEDNDFSPARKNSSTVENNDSKIHKSRLSRIFECCTCSSKSSDSKSKTNQGISDLGNEIIAMAENADASNGQLIILTD